MKLSLILLLSLAVRLTVPSVTPVTGIAQFYREAGLSIQSGYGYAWLNGTRPIEYNLPGYAYFRAADLAPFVPLVDGILGPLLLYSALKGRRGLIAAALYAGALPLAVASRWQLPDALTTLVCLCAVCSLLIWRDWRGATLSGLALGIGGWFRGDFLVLIPLLAMVVFATMNWRSAIIYIFAWLVPALALGLFWLFTYGAFSLSRPGAGLNLWEGLGEYPNPWGIVTLDEAAAKLLSDNSLRYGTSAGDAFLGREYFKDAAQAPGIVIGQIARRFWRVVTLQDADWGISITGWLLVCTLMIFAAFGFWRTRASPVTWAFGALWLSRAGPFSVLHAEPRYVLPLLVVYIVGTSLVFEKPHKRNKFTGELTHDRPTL